jgi:hypothetical protein
MRTASDGAMKEVLARFILSVFIQNVLLLKRMDSTTNSSMLSFLRHPLQSIAEDEMLYKIFLGTCLVAGVSLLVGSIVLLVKIISVLRVRDDNKVDVENLAIPTLQYIPPKPVEIPPTQLPYLYPIGKSNDTTRTNVRLPPYTVVPNSVQSNKRLAFRDEPLMALA